MFSIIVTCGILASNSWPDPAQVLGGDPDYTYTAFSAGDMSGGLGDDRPVTRFLIRLKRDPETGALLESEGKTLKTGLKSFTGPVSIAGCPSDWICLGNVVLFAVPKRVGAKRWKLGHMVYTEEARVNVALLGKSYDLLVIKAADEECIGAPRQDCMYRLFYYSPTDGLIGFAVYDYGYYHLTHWWSDRPHGFGYLALNGANAPD